MSSPWWIVFRKELRETLRDRRTLFVMIAVPVLLYPGVLIGAEQLSLFGTRNLESRVEVLTPVENSSLQEELDNIFEVQLNDHCKTWDMQGDGTYVKRSTDGDQEDCQRLLIDAATRRQFEATRLRKRKPRGVARRISA